MTLKYKNLTKTELANQMGVSRSMLYYQPKQEAIDEEVRSQIEAVMADNLCYGHKRIALALKLNKKRILRVMKKFNLQPYRRRRKPRKRADERRPKSKYKNLIKNFCPIVPNIVWVSDFTYIKFHEKFIYLATIIDLFGREVVGWNISRFHTKELVLGALEHALSNPDYSIPQYLHSDPGSEYDSQIYTKTAQDLKIKISMSKKQSPWENPHQESFYSHFKLDLGDPSRFETIGELIEQIHKTIYYYNNGRIHSALKMPPVKFRKQFEKQQKKIKKSLKSLRLRV